MTSDEDVQKTVDYFKTKATGATIEEAKPILKKYVDPRKITAYLRWKILKKEGDRFKLDELGKQLSRTSEEGKKEIYAQVIKNVKPYHACVEWSFHQKYETITNVEVAAFWHENYSTEVGKGNETSIKDAAVSLFYLLHAAGLGKSTMGRRGLATRFDFESSAIGQYIGATSLSSSEDEDEAEEISDEQEKPEVKIGSSILDSKETIPVENKDTKIELQGVNHKVFISHSANMEIVDQIKTMLDIASLEYEVAVDKESTAIPVPEKVFAAMRSSTSAIICVTADEKLKTSDNIYTINQNVLIEIGAAFVLYDKKVALVWDKRIPVPSNLQGLYRCEFQGDELTWSAGMKCRS